jgi:hypothetical protein
MDQHPLKRNSLRRRPVCIAQQLPEPPHCTNRHDTCIHCDFDRPFHHIFHTFHSDLTSSFPRRQAVCPVGQACSSPRFCVAWIARLHDRQVSSLSWGFDSGFQPCIRLDVLLGHSHVVWEGCRRLQSGYHRRWKQCTPAHRPAKQWVYEYVLLFPLA